MIRTLNDHLWMVGSWDVLIRFDKIQLMMLTCDSLRCFWALLHWLCKSKDGSCFALSSTSSASLRFSLACISTSDSMFFSYFISTVYFALEFVFLFEFLFEFEFMRKWQDKSHYYSYKLEYTVNWTRSS